MANNTKIEWCDMTINPIVGCSKCSPGCDNCYAERMAARQVTMHYVDPKYAAVITDRKWNGKTASHYGCFKKLPGSNSRRRLIFVNSMGDVFYDRVDMTEVMVLFQYIQMFPQHTFLILTKRAKRMRHVIEFESSLRDEDCKKGIVDQVFFQWPLANVWLGVTVCNADEKGKIDDLRATPAAKRFISFEPLLGGVGELDLTGIDWVIVGGETGPGARPMHPDWARSIRNQCQAAKVPFFFKQWGEWISIYDRDNDDPDRRNVPATLQNNERYFNHAGGHGVHGERVLLMRRIGKKAAGCLLAGREWKEFPV